MTLKEKQVLYHITEARNLPGIQAEGLVPLIGDTSALSAEEEPYVYLCDLRSVPYWMLILQVQDPVLIRAEVDRKDVDEYDYSYYTEYLASGKIAPSGLSVRRIPQYVRKHMGEANQDLCESYIYTIASLCLNYARYYTGTSDIREEELEVMNRTVLKAVRGLDYRAVPEKEIRKTIRESGDGGYAFTDHFCNTRRRLWSQLPHYKKDRLENGRMELYRFIRETFSYALYIETGVWDCDR